ncbi:hypothetical protein HDU76_009186, partial [Blyttiomyces sp. JEL0837]
MATVGILPPLFFGHGGSSKGSPTNNNINNHNNMQSSMQMQMNDNTTLCNNSLPMNMQDLNLLSGLDQFGLMDLQLQMQGIVPPTSTINTPTPKSETTTNTNTNTNSLLLTLSPLPPTSTSHQHNSHPQATKKPTSTDRYAPYQYHRPTITPTTHHNPTHDYGFGSGMGLSTLSGADRLNAFDDIMSEFEDVILTDNEMNYKDSPNLGRTLNDLSWEVKYGCMGIPNGANVEHLEKMVPNLMNGDIDIDGILNMEQDPLTSNVFLLATEPMLARLPPLATAAPAPAPMMSVKPSSMVPLSNGNVTTATTTTKNHEQYTASQLLLAVSQGQLDINTAVELLNAANGGNDKIAKPVIMVPSVPKTNNTHEQVITNGNETVNLDDILAGFEMDVDGGLLEMVGSGKEAQQQQQQQHQVPLVNVTDVDKTSTTSTTTTFSDLLTSSNLPSMGSFLPSPLMTPLLGLGMDFNESFNDVNANADVDEIVRSLAFDNGQSNHESLLGVEGVKEKVGEKKSNGGEQDGTTSIGSVKKSTVHVNAGNYKCDFNGCSSVFLTMQKLKSHQVCHMEADHPCELCTMTFRRQTRHAEQPLFHCVECGITFKRKDGLRRHQRVQGHGGGGA